MHAVDMLSNSKRCASCIILYMVTTKEVHPKFRVLGAVNNSVPTTRGG